MANKMIKVIDNTNGTLTQTDSLVTAAILEYKKLSNGSYFIIKYRYGKQNYVISAEQLIALLTSVANS